jgi:hypothetical protein
MKKEEMFLDELNGDLWYISEKIDRFKEEEYKKNIFKTHKNYVKYKEFSNDQINDILNKEQLNNIIKRIKLIEEEIKVLKDTKQNKNNNPEWDEGTNHEPFW